MTPTAPAVLLLELEILLADAAAARRAALRQALADEGAAVSDAEYDAHCAGIAPRPAATAALTLRGRGDDHTTIDLVTLRAERAFTRWLGSGATLAAGARDLVAGAAGRVRLAAVTRARRADASFVLSLAGLDDAFECVVSADDVPDAKPSPAPYRRALERLSRRGGESADDVARASVALEDSAAGIRAARAAGVRCVVVGAVPAHVALEADAAVASLAGHTATSLIALAAPKAGAPPSRSTPSGGTTPAEAHRR